jgi:regulator of replication initiation timing
MVTKTAMRDVELEPLDRLEEKLKRLVALVDHMKSEQARASEENQRLRAEIDALRSRASSADSLAAEIASLRSERDVIRNRVGEMLQQIEALNL